MVAMHQLTNRTHKAEACAAMAAAVNGAVIPPPLRSKGVSSLVALIPGSRAEGEGLPWCRQDYAGEGHRWGGWRALLLLQRQRV